MQEINYTIINHNARKEFGLSPTEYMVADLIYNLSNNPTGDYPHWCYASKETMGEMLGLSRQSIQTIINTLVEKSLVEKHDVTKHLRTTDAWYKKVIIKDSKDGLHGVKKLYTDSKETLHEDSKETLHNKDIYNKDNNKDTNTNVLGSKMLPVKVDKRDLEVQEGMDFFKELYGSSTKQNLNRYALKRLLRDKGKDRVYKALEFAKKMQEDKYCPAIHNFMDLEEKWSKLELYATKLVKGGGRSQGVRIAMMPNEG